MAQETYTKEQLWAGLEELGEDAVRVRLLTKIYGDVGHKRALVEEWLRRREQSRIDASNAEQRRIARSAKNAAWTAATAAMIAAASAIISIVFNLMK